MNKISFVPKTHSKEWAESLDYLFDITVNGSEAKIIESANVLKKHFELQDALSYFHTADKYGWSDPTDGLIDEEIINLYHKALANEDKYDEENV